MSAKGGSTWVVCPGGVCPGGCLPGAGCLTSGMSAWWNVWQTPTCKQNHRRPIISWSLQTPLLGSIPKVWHLNWQIFPSNLFKAPLITRTRPTECRHYVKTSSKLFYYTNRKWRWWSDWGVSIRPWHSEQWSSRCGGRIVCCSVISAQQSMLVNFSSMTLEFFVHNSRLIRWIEQNDLTKDWIHIACWSISHSNHYTRLCSVLVLGCKLILFMHGWLCPIHLVHHLNHFILKKTLDWIAAAQVINRCQ